MNFMNIWTSATDENKDKRQDRQNVTNSNFQRSPSIKDDDVHSPSSRVNITSELNSFRQVPNSSAAEYSSVLDSPSPVKFTGSTSRPCLAGTQTMKQLARADIKLDPIHKAITRTSNISNSSMSSGYYSACRTDPGTELSDYDSIIEANMLTMSEPICNNNRRLTIEERHFLSNLFEKYTRDRRWESSAITANEHLGKRDMSNSLEISGSNKFSNQIKSTIETPLKQAFITKSEENKTPSRSNLPNEFPYSTPIPNTHSGKDLQMLEENLASVSRYVEELTGGNSNQNSRESSCVRATESVTSRDVVQPYCIEPSKEESFGLKLNNVLPVESNSVHTDQKKTGFQTIKEAKIVPEKSYRLSTSRNDQQLNLMASFLGQIPSSSTCTATAQTALGEMMKNLQIKERLRMPNQAAVDTNVRMESSPNDQNDNNNFDPTQSITNNNISSPIPDPNFSNQILNLQAALAAISPAALNVLINNLSTKPSVSQIVDIKETFRRLLFNQMENESRTTKSTGNSGILSIINNMLMANDQTLTSTTSSLTALAAALDSSTGLFNQQFNSSVSVPSERNINCNQSNLNRCSTNQNYIPRNQNQASHNTTNISYHRPYSAEVPQMVGPYCQFLSNVEGDIDRAATIYRNSANNVIQKTDVTCHWSGKLPVRNYNSMNLSRKVFLGGVPWDSGSDDLIYTFSQFGNLSVLWPQREGYSGNSGYDGHERASTPKGYCYLLFEYESCVCELLSRCVHDPVTNGDYFKLSSPKYKTKDVQVIPWVISDSQYIYGNQSRLESGNTIFVGALHGMITAETLANIMSSLFGDVVFAALDTDKHKYPIGSGRVVFADERGYMKAVTANFVEVRTPKFTKTLQIDPFLEDSNCNNCLTSPGIYFCRAFKCFRYFCPACWHQWHNYTESLANHKPLRRSLKPSSNPFII